MIEDTTPVKLFAFPAEKPAPVDVSRDIEILDKWFANPTLDSFGPEELFAWSHITKWIDNQTK